MYVRHQFLTQWSKENKDICSSFWRISSQLVFTTRCLFHYFYHVAAIVTRKRNCFHCFMWDVITRPSPNFNGALFSKLWHWWVITARIGVITYPCPNPNAQFMMPYKYLFCGHCGIYSCLFFNSYRNSHRRYELWCVHIHILTKNIWRSSRKLCQVNIIKIRTTVDELIKTSALGRLVCPMSIEWSTVLSDNISRWVPLQCSRV